MLVGGAGGFLAYVKREPGAWKALAVWGFFVILLVYLLLEPWLPLYILAWLGSLM